MTAFFILASVLLIVYGVICIWATAYDSGIISILIAIGMIVSAYMDFKRTESNNTPEYTLDLINQDTVLIRNVSTGREYTVRPERIVETLENDNL